MATTYINSCDIGLECRERHFFASNGLEVEALDYSAFVVELLNKTAKKKRLPLKPHFFE